MNKKRVIIYSIVFIEIIAIFCFKRFIDARSKAIRIEILPENPNALRQVHKDPPAKEIEIFLNSPVELDYLTKKEVYGLRKKYVDQHKDLIEEPYEPLEYTFGQIVGGKPWWGIRGQFCNGNGDRSIEGLSEETRFIANPFHLLYLTEGMAYRKESCFPVYPRPYKLLWSLDEPKAIAKYDLTKFYQDKDYVGHFRYLESLVFDRINAIDFGYNYLFIDPKLSKGVGSTKDSRVLKEVCLIRGFIHLGGSCGYPGKCNNGSPTQPELYFRVSKLPAKVYCKLWKTRPKSKKDKADFVFIVELN